MQARLQKAVAQLAALTLGLIGLPMASQSPPAHGFGHRTSGSATGRAAEVRTKSPAVNSSARAFWRATALRDRQCGWVMSPARVCGKPLPRRRPETCSWNRQTALQTTRPMVCWRAYWMAYWVEYWVAYRLARWMAHQMTNSAAHWKMRWAMPQPQPQPQPVLGRPHARSCFRYHSNRPLRRCHCLPAAAASTRVVANSRYVPFSLACHGEI